MTTKSKEEIMAEMDDAADRAREEFKALIVEYPDAVAAIAEWHKRNTAGAGHKRLGRIINSVAD